MIAYFLKSYGGYTFESLINEYSLRVLYMLNESIRIDAYHRLEDITITSLPHIEEASTRKEIIDSYQNKVDGIIDLDEDPEPNATEKLKKIFRRKRG